ncbi:formyltransferase family protein [Hyphobacterium indicum]|uniref:formyltransferase family protein n=1 Tax=Hyphobacterium indicum TaxID=2162714 RepID=UPI000D653344|nr:formyltransferase family protein [Hyphobacterium indicum]
MSRIILLTAPHVSEALVAAVRKNLPDLEPVLVYDRGEFDAAVQDLTPNDFLLSFCTNVIVPADVIGTLGPRAINIHPAAPDYPGRDPHHFAFIDGVRRYGATAHRMTESVDAGPIYDIEWFDVPDGASPHDIMLLADEAGQRLAERIFTRLGCGERLEPNGVEWGPCKTSRNDFRRLCRISPIAYKAEFDRRMAAVANPEYRNAFVDLHGRVFRDTGETFQPVRVKASKGWEDFTEAAYCEILDAAKDRYRFTTYDDLRDDDHVLWRHDIDYSVHRGVRLAELEAERGLVATYFFWIRAPYYNVLEPAIKACAARLLDLGHRIGLHFDIQGYGDEKWTYEKLDVRIRREADFLGAEFNTRIGVVSFHDPENGGLLNFDADRIGGLVNAYAARFKRDYGYCSDSNGYWRFKPIPEVIRSGEYRKLQVLTHPAWWTGDIMSPREKIERAVLGRARATMAEYDDHLTRSGRTNLD